MRTENSMSGDEVYARPEEEEAQVFEVEMDGKVTSARLLTVVEIGGTEYAVYSVRNEKGTCDIFASYVRKDEEGYDTLEDIDDPEDKKRVADFVKSFL